MTQPDPPILNYENPAHSTPRIGIAPLFIGIVGGVAAHWIGENRNPLYAWLAVPALGLIIGLACAFAARSREYIAGIIGNATSAATVLVVPIAVSFALSRPYWMKIGPGALLEILPVVGLVSILFILPGLLASHWVVERRHAQDIRTMVKEAEERRSRQ